MMMMVMMESFNKMLLTIVMKILIKIYIQNVTRVYH